MIISQVSYRTNGPLVCNNGVIIGFLLGKTLPALLSFIQKNAGSSMELMI